MLSDDSKYTAIPAWTESTRDFMKFNKRKGDLPVQQEGDAMDIRGIVALPFPSLTSVKTVTGVLVLSSAMSAACI